MKSEKIDVQEAALRAFLIELDQLSYRHGIALSEGATLFLMERYDYECRYTATDESALIFA